MKIRILYFIIIVLIFIGISAYYIFKPNPDSVKRINPKYTVQAEHLFLEFSLDEQKTNKKYLGKVISITGNIVSILKDSEERIVVNLAGSNTGKINCTFGSKEELPNDFEKGNTVKIKGSCTGFIYDVILIRCCADD